MNRAVLAYHTLQAAIGSEWKHKSPGSNVVRITELDGHALTVSTSGSLTFNVLEFLKTHAPVPPPDKVPSWYERLIADRLLSV